MLTLILIDVQYSQKAVFSFEKGSNRQNNIFSGFLRLVKNLPHQNFRFAPTYIFDWVVNTCTPEVGKKDIRTTSFMLFLCFCWFWTNLVHWFSRVFDIFHKLMFPLFWTSKHHLRKIFKNEKNRSHNTLLKCLSRKSFGIKNNLQTTEMIQE